ncbi:LutC/YkgG family protein [Faunimonas sp. B44]|uniref:LutC/YkgG family protein n=1 Tax=Faunimonas sp. B44 TaxID=3461493 RepID=UPI0040445088
MSTRDIVLAKVRRALAGGGPAAARTAAVERRLSERRPNLVPARGQLPPAERVALFCLMAERVNATVARLAGPEDVPAALADHLRRHNLPASLRMGADPRLQAMPWHLAPQVELRAGPSDGHDAVGLSHAFAGVAETGTLMLTSGPDNPTTVTFLPDTHVVVVSAADIVGDFETAWARLREALGPGAMPRTVNLVTGPSRSADIEQTLILGAHGPRALHILVVGNP